MLPEAKSVYPLFENIDLLQLFPVGNLYKYVSSLPPTTSTDVIFGQHFSVIFKMSLHVFCFLFHVRDL